MKDRIISASKLSSDKDIINTMIMRSVHERLFNIASLDITLHRNNIKGLPALYNEALQQHTADTRWLIFAHDDVYIDDNHVIDKLNKAHQTHKYDIVGLAGCVDPAIKPYNLWHVMADRTNLRGHVAHPAGVVNNGEQQITVTSFGPTPSRVALIDGLFMAVHVPTVVKTAWKFNENYMFHHYDIASCIDANKHKLRIGVYPINVMHTSPGLKSVEDINWKASNERFLKEYATRQ